MNVPQSRDEAVAPELIGERRLNDFHVTDERYRTARTAIRTAGWLFAAWMAFGCIEALAGKTTAVDVALTMAISAFAKFEVLLAVALTGSAVAWAVVERVLRLRKVEQMQGRIRELETRIDPKRSTSGLTRRGKTNPKDVRK